MHVGPESLPHVPKHALQLAETWDDYCDTLSPPFVRAVRSEV